MTIALMVDLETLSSQVDAVIVSIGAVVFDTEQEDTVEKLAWHGLNRRVQIKLAQQPNRHIDPETVVWWVNQSQGARDEAFSDKAQYPLRDVLGELSMLYSNSGCVEVWSHGSSFDLPILQHAYEQLGMKAAWKYRGWRDTRTLLSLVPEELHDSLWPANPGKHQPLLDAATQAVMVQRALRWVMHTRPQEMDGT